MEERYAESTAYPRALCQASLKPDPWRDPLCGDICSTPLQSLDNDLHGEKNHCCRWRSHQN